MQTCFFFFSVTPSEPLNVKALINRLIKWTSPVLANRVMDSVPVCVAMQSSHSSVDSVPVCVAMQSSHSSVTVCVS